MTRRTDVPAAIIDLGNHTKLWIYGDQATYGIPTVELTGIDALNCMRPEDAERIADALKLAARLARGEQVPTQLDEFLSRRAAP
jgi:hypothetical protein